MIIAVSTEWGEDFSRFAYYQVENGTLKRREEAAVAPGGARQLALQLVGLEIDLLLCCAIGESLSAELEQAGVTVISGLAPGRADAVLSGYLDGTLSF